MAKQKALKGTKETMPGAPGKGEQVQPSNLPPVAEETVEANPNPAEVRAKAKERKAAAPEAEGVPPVPAVSPTDGTETEEVFQARIKAEKIAALNLEVETLAAGREYNKVVHQFENLAGGKVGTNLAFYLRCKLNEIETGQPCNFVRPIAPPVQQLQPTGKAGFAPIGGQAQTMKTTKNCPGKNCK